MDRLLGGAGGTEVHLSTLAPLGLPESVLPRDIAAVHSHFLRRWRRRSEGGAPALVWLDDVHYVDPLSADILRQAVATGVIQLLGTYRDTEPLHESIAALHTEALADVVDVPPLDRHAADQLARTVAGADVGEQALNRVHALAAGNPLFIRELTRAITEGEGWLDPGPLEVIVGRPVLALAGSSRHVLDVVALAEPVPERLLAPYLNELRDLRRLGLIAQHGADAVRIDHPLRRAWLLRELAPCRADLARELLHLVDSEGSVGEIDPIALVDWQLEAGLVPDAQPLEVATRAAIARADGLTALRFTQSLTGPTGELLRGQALVIAGRLTEGLKVLADVAQTGPIDIAVEAAFWRAKYLGVMLGDYRSAERALDDVDALDLAPSARRVVFAGRLWLWVFGRISDPAALDDVMAILDEAPADEAAFEVAIAAASLLYQVHGPAHAQDLMTRVDSMARELPVSDAGGCRASTVQAWWEVANGSAMTGVRAMRVGVTLAERSGRAENISLMAGSAGLLIAQTGRIAEGLRVSATSGALPEIADWFQYRRLAAAVHSGNLCLAGRAHEVVAVPDPLAAHVIHQCPDLYPLFLVRAQQLHQQATGLQPDDRTLLLTLELLAQHRKHLWVALIGSEITSMSTDPAVHRLILASSNRVAGPGLVHIVGRVSRARLGHDPIGLMRAGQDLESTGMLSAASRVMADVATLTAGDSPEGQSARASLLRLRRGWDGGPMWWLDTVPDLPSTRQMEIAWRAVDGMSTGDIAADLFLSARTVENHVYRVCRALHVTGRSELADLLSLPQQPTYRCGREPDSPTF